MVEEKAESGGGGLFGKVVSFFSKAKFVDPIRPLLYKIGGRKVALTGASLFVIERIVSAAGDSFGWPHAIACLSAAIASVGFSFANASEDKAEKSKPKE